MLTTAASILPLPAAMAPELQTPAEEAGIQGTEALLSLKVTMLPKENIQKEAALAASTLKAESQAAVPKEGTATEAALEEAPAEGDDWNCLLIEIDI